MAYNKKRVASVILFASGKIVAFGENGQQIPEIQMNSAIELWAEYASGAGYDVDGCKFSTQSEPLKALKPPKTLKQPKTPKQLKQLKTQDNLASGVITEFHDGFLLMPDLNESLITA